MSLDTDTDNLLPSFKQKGVDEDDSLKIVNFGKFYNEINAKHAADYNIKKMGSSCKWPIGYWIIIFVVLLLLFWPISYPESFTTFFKRSIEARLARDGWYCYVASWCGYSIKQMNELRDFSNFIVTDTGEGDIPNDTPYILLPTQVTSYPTWFNVNTGQKLPGYIPKTELVKLM